MNKKQCCDYISYFVLFCFFVFSFCFVFFSTRLNQYSESILA